MKILNYLHVKFPLEKLTAFGRSKSRPTSRCFGSHRVNRIWLPKVKPCKFDHWWGRKKLIIPTTLLVHCIVSLWWNMYG